MSEQSVVTVRCYYHVAVHFLTEYTQGETWDQHWNIHSPNLLPQKIKHLNLINQYFILKQSSDRNLNFRTTATC